MNNDFGGIIPNFIKNFILREYQNIMDTKQYNQFSVLLSTKFIKLSKPLIKLIGLQPAITFCELLSEYKYWKDTNGLTPDDFFFSTEINLSKNTGLSASQLRNCFKILQDKKFIFVQRRELPSKNYFRINPDILPQLEIDLKTIDSESKSQKPTDNKLGRISF